MLSYQQQKAIIEKNKTERSTATVANQIIIGSGAAVNSHQSDGNGGIATVAIGNVVINQYLQKLDSLTMKT